MHYLIEVKDQIFVKDYGFFFFCKIWAKRLLKIWVKTWAVNITKTFLIMLHNLPQKHLKLLQKSSIEHSRNNGWFNCYENCGYNYKSLRKSTIKEIRNSWKWNRNTKWKINIPRKKEEIIVDLTLEGWT